MTQGSRLPLIALLTWLTSMSLVEWLKHPVSSFIFTTIPLPVAYVPNDLLVDAQYLEVNHRRIEYFEL